MRLLRFIGLVATIGAVYFAQYIFDHYSLSEFFPIWLLDAYPPLYRFARWLPADLFTLALWIAALAMILFGLLTPAWRAPKHVPEQPRLHILREPPTPPLTSRIALYCMLLAVVTAVVTLLVLWRTGTESRFVQIAWVSALLVFLLGNIPLDLGRAQRLRRPVVQEDASRPWVYLLLIVGSAALLFAWPLTELPVQIDEATVQMGLHAQAIATGAETHLFGATQDQPSLLALTPTALAIWLSGDPLLGTHLVGIFAGLLTVVATWLLGGELFRRTPVWGYFGECMEDNGQWLALMAALIVAATYGVLQFSRLPVYLEPVGWGCLALWALVRGLRTDDRLALALSGVLTGLVLHLYSSGFLFFLIIPFWWVGIRLLQRFTNRGDQKAKTNVGPRQWYLLTWLGGLLIAGAPRFGLWLRTPTLLTDHFQGALEPNLWATLLAFTVRANGANPLTYPFLDSILAPLLLLAIGALLFNLDRLPGLLLLLWLGGGLLLNSNLTAHGPGWSTLLPLTPAIALAVAFTLDRARITMVATLGEWVNQAATFLAVGVVAWALMFNWVTYYQMASATGDAASYTGREIRAAGSDQPVVLLLGQQVDRIDWNSPTIAFLAANRPNPQNHLTLQPGAWPESLPPDSMIIVQPEDQASVAELMMRYPGGVLTTQRDWHSNPILYLYHLP